MKRTALNNFLAAYIIVTYVLMFVILWENRNHKDICARNMLELMTAAAPITTAYLIVKVVFGFDGCNLKKDEK